jgi:hypothetical protein
MHRPYIKLCDYLFSLSDSSEKSMMEWTTNYFVSSVKPT